MKIIPKHNLFAILAFLCAPALSQPAPKLLPFQGRLTDQNGVAVSNGVHLVQFKIYDVPTGGSPVWAGELHRTTVNGGLVNVMLGTKTPLSAIDFDKQLYLEITVDVSGPTGTPDNSITAADPPMLPRQAILPVVFAKEAADSRLLDGYDWSSLYNEGATNPAAAKIAGARIVHESITALQLAPQTITATQIASNTITAAQIAPGTISTRELSGGLATLPGTISAFGGASVPADSGWLLCDGKAVSSQQYPQLFSAISTNWGGGVSGSTNDFNLPDLRGLFLRGVNGQRTDFLSGSTNYMDPDVPSRTKSPSGGSVGNKVGSLQGDIYAIHSHPAHNTAQGTGFIEGTYSPAFQVSSGTGLGMATFVETGFRGGLETRPKNAYVNYIIKY